MADRDKLTTAELMAIEVLKGNLDTARMLADSLPQDMYETTGQRVAPINKVTASLGRIRVVAYVDPALSGDAQIDQQQFEQSVREWLRGDRSVLNLFGIDRIEIYELPAGLTEGTAEEQEELTILYGNSSVPLPGGVIDAEG